MNTSDHIPALIKSGHILNMIANEGSSNAKTLSSQLKIPSATCYRILKTLHKMDWIVRDKEGYYSLSFGLSRLTQGLEHFSKLRQLLEEPIAHLAHETECAARVSIFWIRGCHKVIACQPDDSIGPYPTINRWSPIRGAAGTILMQHFSKKEIQHAISIAGEKAWQYQSEKDIWARLAQSKKRDYVIDLHSNHPYIGEIAMAIDNEASDTPAALSLFTWKNELNRSKVQKLRKIMQATIADCRQYF